MSTETHISTEADASLQGGSFGALSDAQKASSEAPSQQADSNQAGTKAILVAASFGAVVSLTLGTYGNVHGATGDKIFALGFPTLLAMKAWLATGAAVLALGQLASALWMWGRLPFAGSAPSVIAPIHRWSGTVAFLLTLPVAYHCLWALGFRDNATRVLVHSILGCAFYGVFSTKMLLLRSDHLPGWTLPAAGGALVMILTGIWWTSSLWFFQTIGFPGL